ncbi:hypothetical protein Tdes44962_MAKER09100, partial [Teratosphaeria destructans]
GVESVGSVAGGLQLEVLEALRLPVDAEAFAVADEDVARAGGVGSELGHAAADVALHLGGRAGVGRGPFAGFGEVGRGGGGARGLRGGGGDGRVGRLADDAGSFGAVALGRGGRVGRGEVFPHDREVDVVVLVGAVDGLCLGVGRGVRVGPLEVRPRRGRWLGEPWVHFLEQPLLLSDHGRVTDVATGSMTGLPPSSSWHRALTRLVTFIDGVCNVDAGADGSDQVVDDLS